MFWQFVPTVHLDQLALPITSDSLALLAIILDVFATFCARFAIPSILCDLLAIIIYILRFLAISGTFTSTPRPSHSSTLTPATQQPHTPRLRSETSQTSHIAPSTCPIAMPLRRDHSAPYFDPRQPRELRSYFADLADHFAQSEIDDDQEKKRYACRYVDIDTEELWESRLERSDRAKSFSDFVQAIYRLYPGAEGQQQWLVADMERLVEERSQMGIRTLGDLGDYYRSFIAITTFLCGRNRLSNRDQSQAFMQGLSCDLRDRVSRRLQLKFPDHLADDPYRLDDIYEAAQFILHGTATSVSITATQCDHLISPKSPDVAKHCPSSREAENHRTASPRVALDHITSHRLVEDRPASSRFALPRLTSPRVTLPCITSPKIANHHLSSCEVKNHRISSPRAVEDRLASPRLALPRLTSSRVALPCFSLPNIVKHCPSSHTVENHRVSSPRVALDSMGSPGAVEHRPASPKVTDHRLTSLGIADHLPALYSSPFDRTAHSSMETPLCNFCGHPGHFIKQCVDAEEYIQLGKCRRTSDGRIALPTGSFVSRDVPGRFMKYRIDEWHRRDPERLGANGYMHGIAPTATDSRLPMHKSSPLRFEANPTAETSNYSLSVQKRSSLTKGEPERPQERTSIAPIALGRASPSLWIEDPCKTLCTVPTPLISPGERFTPSADIPSHSPALCDDKTLQLACPDRTFALDFASRTTDRESRIGNRMADIMVSPPHHSNIARTTTDHFSLHSAYGPHHTSEMIAPHCTSSPAHSDITPAADISDSRLTAASRIRAIERELAQLRSRTRVAPMVPHSAYHAPESPNVSNHNASPAIIFRQST
jgi:hypothetical protein